MSRSEQALPHRWAGRKILIRSIALGCVGVVPLLLYIALGPADGNPIGLGLLAVTAVLVAGIGAVVGLLKMIVELFGRRGA